MGLIREPEGVDFIIAGGPLSAKDAKVISAWIKKHRAERDRVKAKAERLEAQLLALPTAERTQLVQRLVASLANGDSQPVNLTAPQSAKKSTLPASRRKKSAARKVMAEAR